MTNLEKYNNIFIEIFGVKTAVLNDTFGKDSVDQWDSVHQLTLISMAEDTFDIMLDPEDIIGFTSYSVGKAILLKQGIEI